MKLSLRRPSIGSKVAGLGLLLGLFAGARSVRAETFEWSWTPGAGEGQVTATVSTYLYGKRWAYGIEFDDGNEDAFIAADPLLAGYEFSDAPPGVAGGTARRFVGTAAIFPYRISGNDAFLSWTELSTLLGSGWGIASHSYWHEGTLGAPLTAEGYRRELYWSQQVIGVLALGGRAPTHLVYPNGDTNYGTFLAEFGLSSGSRVGGTSTNDLTSGSLNLTDFPRNYLDEGYWTDWGASDPEYGLPASEPAEGSFVLDFTHNLDANTGSANHQRWVARLNYLETNYGSAGNDSLWCAPSPAVFAYAAAAKVASVEVSAGHVSVSIPDELAGTPLTVALSGVAGDAVVAAPEGGVVHRDGGNVWLTTPMIGEPGVALPGPALMRVYEGPIAEVTLDPPQEVAGVRLRQSGDPGGSYSFEIVVDKPDGSSETLASDTPASAWGVWHVYDRLPASAAITASKVRLSATHSSFTEMEVWAVNPEQPSDGGAPGSGGTAGTTSGGGGSAGSANPGGSGGGTASAGAANGGAAGVTTSAGTTSAEPGNRSPGSTASCSCRTAGTNASASAAWLTLLAMGLWRRRLAMPVRRRARRIRQQHRSWTRSPAAHDLD